MNQDEIWDFHQTELTDSFLGSRARLEWLARLLVRNEKVLNIGVGGGIFEDIALRRGVEVYAVDPSSRTIAMLRDRLGLGERAQTGRGEQLPFPDDQFTTVIVSEVLEHLSDVTLDETLKEIRRVLSPGGRIIGTVPNREDLKDQLVVCPHCTKRFHRWGHVRSFNVSTMSMTLGRYFAVTKIEPRLFISWETLNWKGKIIAFVKRLLFSLGVHGGDENLFFVASKR